MKSLKKISANHFNAPIEGFKIYSSRGEEFGRAASSFPLLESKPKSITHGTGATGESSSQLLERASLKLKKGKQTMEM
jgi:hypothetical protein